MDDLGAIFTIAFSTPLRCLWPPCWVPAQALLLVQLHRLMTMAIAPYVAVGLVV